MLSIKKSTLIAVLAVVGIFAVIGYGIYTDCKNTVGYVDCSGL